MVAVIVRSPVSSAVRIPFAMLSPLAECDSGLLGGRAGTLFLMVERMSISR